MPFYTFRTMLCPPACQRNLVSSKSNPFFALSSLLMVAQTVRSIFFLSVSPVHTLPMPPPAALAPPAVSTRSLTANRARLSRRRPTTMGTSGAPLPSRAPFAHLAGHTVAYSVLVSTSRRLLYTESRSYKKLAKTELDPSGHYNISLLMPRRQATSTEQKSCHLVAATTSSNTIALNLNASTSASTASSRGTKTSPRVAASFFRSG